MQAIQATIQPGDTGPQVANLYEALLVLLERGVIKALEPPNTPTAEDLGALKEQIRSKAPSGYYKGAAVTLVQLFQIQSGLGDALGGVVEDQTADLLNQQLKKHRAIDDPEGYCVEGWVVDEQGRGLADVPVHLFEEDVTGPSPIAEPTKTSTEGRYHFRFGPSDYMEGDYGEFIQPGPPREDAPGRYMAAFVPRFTPPVTRRVLSGPDLWVGAGEDGKEPMARTAVIFNVGSRTTMPDLVLTRSALHKGMSDLERVLGLVVPRLKGLGLASLSNAQMEFLASDCEEPLALIQALVAAARSEDQARTIAGEFDFAWSEAADLLFALQFTISAEQEAAGLEQLLQLADDAVERTLQAGIERNRLPKTLAPMIPAFVPWLAELRARHRLSGKPDNSARPLEIMLATLPDGIGLKSDALLGVAGALDFWGRDSERFYAALDKAGLDERQTHGVVRTLSLSDLTGGHVPLVKMLQLEDPKPENAALYDVAALDRDEWSTYIEQVGLPSGVEDTGTYVTGLLRGMEQRAPTAYLLARMGNGRIAFDQALLDPSRSFAARNPDFRFGTDSVFTRFGQPGAVDGMDEAQVQPLLQELLHVERIARATPNLEAAEIVLRKGYGSAYEITRRTEDDFIAEMKTLLPGSETEARATYASAQAITESAFAVFLALSPQANGEGQVQLLSAPAPQGTGGSGPTTSRSTTSAMTAAGAAAQAATVALLFGNQDACACEACSAMGSPSHYLAELLNLLDESGPKVTNTTGQSLSTLLQRRPDLQEIELDCDNANRVMPYVDLLLELLEAPLIEKDLLLPRSTGASSTDPLPSPNPQVPSVLPAALVNILRNDAGIIVGSSATATQRSTQPPSWLIKGGGWRFLLTVLAAAPANGSKYSIRMFPQSGSASMPESWGYPAQMLNAAYAPLAIARYPWSLPFDLAEAETNVWLGVLGTSVRAVGELRAGAALSQNDVAARLALRMGHGEWSILTEARTATTSPWLDWGYPSTDVPDPADSAQTITWKRALRTVSSLKQRAGITHLELLELIQCRFIQPATPARLALIGDECDSDKMQLVVSSAQNDPLPDQQLRRIHLFIRLWRRLGWSMRDLDRALSAFPSPAAATGNNAEVLTAEFVRHLAGMVRLCEQTALEPQLALTLFTAVLDTQTYWRQEGTRAFPIPSTYDRLFTDPALNRPRTPGFELGPDPTNPIRIELVRRPMAGEFPLLRLSDHVAVIAGAIGCTAADVLALLPRGEVSIAPQQLSSQAVVNGQLIEIPTTGAVVIELVVGTTVGNQAGSLELRIQGQGTSGGPADVTANHLAPASNQPVTLTLPASGWKVQRFSYQPPEAARAKSLRVQVSGTAGIWLSARVLTATGLVAEDELTLGNVSLLTRHLIMAGAARLSGSAYRTTLGLLGSDPLPAPAAALDFLEQVRRWRSLGFSVEDLDELLREEFIDTKAEQRAQTRICEALEAVRAALAEQEAELILEPGQAEGMLRKALLEAGWSQRLVDLVVSSDLLDPDFKTEHSAKLALPRLTRDRLPRGLSYIETDGTLQFTAPVAGAQRAFSRARKALEKILQSDANSLRAATPALDVLSESVDDTEKQVRDLATRLLKLAQSFQLASFEVDISATISTQEVTALREIRIPAAWSDSLWFDGARRKLWFRGPVTEAWRDELKSLSTQQAFRSAIDELFSKADRFRETSNQSLFEPPNVTGAINLITSSTRGLEQRASALLQRVIPMLRVRRAGLRVAALLEPRLGLAGPVTTALLERYRHDSGADRLSLVGQGFDQGVLLAPDFVRSPITLRVTPQGFPLQYAALRRVFKLATLAQAARLDRDEIDWVVGPWPGSAATGTSQNLAALLPTTPQNTTSGDLQPAWERFTTVLAARERLGNEPGALTGYLMATAQGDLPSAVRAIAEWAGITTQNAQRVVESVVGAATLPDLRDPARLLHLVRCLEWMRQTGCDADSLIAWSAPTLTMSDAARARQFARARVGEAAWAEASRKPLDELRLKRRNALVTHEVQRQGLADANALYGRLLVDPEMGPCMQTTRTRLAISSVQLFVQRIQLGLETGLARNLVNARKWAWMQNYRLWEANLKVLLHSENYLDMSLRREKTPPCRALEADLMQGDITAARASTALSTYLDELEEVSSLQTVGMYRDTPIKSVRPVYERQALYFVGATRNQPKKHFLRKYVRHGPDERDGTWTPWERIDLDLQETYTVSPVVRDGEVTLFWLEFREEAAQRLPANSSRGELPEKFWVPTLRWSRHLSGKWQTPGSLVLEQVASPMPTAKPNVMKRPHEYSLVRDASELDSRVRAVLPMPHTYMINYEEDGRDTYIQTTSIYSKDIFEFDMGQGITQLGQFSNAFERYHGFGELLVTLGPIYSDGRWSIQSPGGSDLAIFERARQNEIRAVHGHQDVQAGFAFRAPLAVTIAGQRTGYPCIFVCDAGNGEILAQPRHEDLTYLRFVAGQTFPNYIRVIGGARRLLLSTAHHPQASFFRRILRAGGLSGFLSLGTQRLPAEGWYLDLQPDRNTIPIANDPQLDVDFRLNGSYSPYNWELFFMIPFAVASELSKQQRFREARDWFHYVFDPTNPDPSTEFGQTLTAGQQFWKFRPFRALNGTASIQELVRKLADATNQSQEKRDFIAAVERWRQDPFDPHLVARFRPVAYQMAVVMAYIKNLITWGDQLFRRDTMESLNEATQLYILAAEILGRPRELIPPRTRRLPQAFAELKSAMAGNAGASALSNPLVAAESVLPLSVPGSAVNVPVPQTLQFCVPSNPAFEELRQTVQDRLFKMRNCMNIDGVERELALFEPPIDPAMLVKARAAGIDVAALLAETSAPPPLYRFNVLAQKATEVCADVKSLGAALLAAMEKGDAEALVRLRSEHELQVLASVRQIKQLQIDEAEAAIKALDPSLEAASRRLHHYLSLLTQVEELTVPTGAAGPTPGSLLVAAVKTITTVGTVASVVAAGTNPLAAAASVALNEAISRATQALSDALASNEASTSKVPMNPAEKNQLIEMGSARSAQNKANDLRLVAQLFAKIPDFKLGIMGVASSPVVTAELGGSLLSSAANFLATMEDARASEHSHRASLQGMLASYQRRSADWMQQALQANSDIEQITRQMASAAIRVAVAAQDLRNHDLQVANAEQVDEWYRTKYTNQELYSWMSQQVSGVYQRSYQLAHDLAKRAERAYQHELGLETTAFVRHGHWDGLKKGLLAGELLYHDIKRMEAAYLDTNARELEITRSISLRQLNVAELMKLRVEGQCGFELPEWLFNMDYPDHYMRRIKSVSVSLPCVVGPYTGISGKLTMLSGKVRTKPVSGSSYVDEANFRGSQLAASSVAISTAQGDSGLFDFNLRDERFLPFEGAGLVDSRWQFELPRHVRQFDYDTISDLVLTIRYTARASTALRQSAIDHLKLSLESDNQALLIDVKRDFPDVWQQAAGLLRTSATSVSLRLDRHFLPYAWARRKIRFTPPNSVWIKVKDYPPLPSSRPLVQATAVVSVAQTTVTVADGNWAINVSGVQLPQNLPAGELEELLLSIDYKEVQ